MRSQLLIVLLVVACKGKSEAPAASVGDVVRGSGSGAAGAGSAAGSGSAASSVPAGFHLEDLNAQPNRLPATIVVPDGAKLESGYQAALDADGLQRREPTVAITLPSSKAGLRIMTAAHLGWVPTTASDDLARNGQFTVEHQAQAAGGGAWAIAYRWTDPAMCWIRGFDPESKLVCETVQQQVACTEVRPLLDACITLKSRGAPLVLAADAAETFPTIKDTALGKLALDVIRAINANDPKPILAAMRKTLRVKGKAMTEQQLQALFAEDGVASAFDMDCKPPADSPQSPCRWNAEGDAANGEAIVFMRDGYGVVPILRFGQDKSTKQWHLVEVGDQDLGEP